MQRIWVPVDRWEEIPHNMWGTVSNRRRCIERAVMFTGNHRLYGRYMMRVITEWPCSCLNAMTDASLNRRAWIGHAACALAIQCPEDITRQAWGMLSHEQRVLANRQADRAIQAWEVRYRSSERIPEAVAAPLLWGGYSGSGARQGDAVRQGSVVEGRGNRFAQK